MTKEQAITIYRAYTSGYNRANIVDTDLANLADAEPWLTPMLMELQAARDDVDNLNAIVRRLEDV